LRVDADVGHVNGTAVLFARDRQEANLVVGHSRGAIGYHGNAHDLTGVRVDSGRHVDGYRLGIGCVDGVDGIGKFSCNVT